MTPAIATTIEAYDSLIARAIAVVSEAPYWKSCYNDEFATLSCDGDMATLSWPMAESGYECSCTIETESVSFPLALLLLSDAELKAWKKEQRALYDQKAKRQAESFAREHEAAERAQLQALKRKYEK